MLRCGQQVHEHCILLFIKSIGNNVDLLSECKGAFGIVQKKLKPHGLIM